jgi:uncharacterized membrane protein
VLNNDTDSVANNVSHDGTVVVGHSSANLGTMHAIRWLGGALQYIPELASLSVDFGCETQAVDSSGTVVGTCEYGYPFQYTNQAVAIDMFAYAGDAQVTDVSQDGTVIVGHLPPTQAYRRTSSGVTPLGTLEPDGHGSLVVGYDDSGFQDTAWSWTSQNGIAPLAKLSGWVESDAWDVSTNGKVIIGFAGASCVKWSGTPFSPVVLGPGFCYATNQDGSVSVGTDSTNAVAMVWDIQGAHKITDLLGSVPNLSGWTLVSATGVSNDGKFVVGNGTHAGHNEGWIAHLA